MMKLSGKRFPMQQSSGRYPSSVPWEMVQMNRINIERNHSQTLERLAERGGLDWAELVCAMAGFRFNEAFPTEEQS